jgi:predicted small integral membrane protein
VSLGAVLQYQAFVNEWHSDIDVESCYWALQVLELSTVPTLPKTQQGGLTLFKLRVDKLDAKTFENTKLLQDYITSFCLD